MGAALCMGGARCDPIIQASCSARKQPVLRLRHYRCRYTFSLFSGEAPSRPALASLDAFEALKSSPLPAKEREDVRFPCHRVHVTPDARTVDFGEPVGGEHLSGRAFYGQAALVEQD
jgi:hypothetical protein